LSSEDLKRGEELLTHLQLYAEPARVSNLEVAACSTCRSSCRRNIANAFIGTGAPILNQQNAIKQ
ncbi:MAG: hypothetical protein WA830_24655, partial [Candidatus Sulfotelmatobacter sp.]